MKDYIINCFILKDKNTLIDIYNYINIRYAPYKNEFIFIGTKK